MNLSFLKKLRYAYVWKRILYERLTEPLHLNMLSAFAGVFGSLRTKIDFDLINRPQHAYSLLKCADRAVRLGLRSVTVIEFGVAAGTGLMNIAEIAEKISLLTGVSFDIVGFDTGKGMPSPNDYRDHPDLYQEGDFAIDVKLVRENLPTNVELIVGELADTLPEFMKRLSPQSPLAFVSIDVDYYSSTRSALEVFKGQSDCYLPWVVVYVDDLEDESHNTYCGELLALREFNHETALRKIEKHPFLRSYRLLKNARWIDHIFTLHGFDHSFRNEPAVRRKQVNLENVYLKKK